MVDSDGWITHTIFFYLGSINWCSKIAVNNGYCFAGNAALFGCSDFRIATKSSWIGMAGPHDRRGGLGVFEPTDIGPVSVHEKNGVVDYVADNEEQGPP